MNLHEMTWEEFESFVKKYGVVVIPVGSTEQHGPHLPLGTDTIVVSEIARKLAEKIDIVVMPSVAWGYKPQPGSSGGALFPGTCSLDGATLIELVRDLLRELIRNKASKIILLDGHYENSLFLNEGVDLGLRDSGCPSDVKVVIARWFDLVKPEEYENIFSGFKGVGLEHAANLETALMLELRPELVNINKIRSDKPERNPPYQVLPPTSNLIPKTGVLTEIGTVSAHQGALIIQIIIERLINLIKQEFNSN
ncbi:MAG: creatininase [Candidatus Bathyarchaeia archaeon]